MLGQKHKQKTHNGASFFNRNVENVSQKTKQNKTKQKKKKPLNVCQNKLP